jgi:hypothetical protein
MAANISTEYSIDPKYITGDRMPNVYINRISLETINVADNTKKSRITAHATSPEQLTNVNIADQSLRVVLNLEIKDTKTGKYSKWFMNRSAKKILEKVEVVVVQTTKPEATRIWAGIKNIDEIQQGDKAKKALDGTDMQFVKLSEFLNADDPRTVFNLQDPEIDDFGISVYNFGKRIHFPDTKSKNSSGVSSKLSPSQKHLAYFVFSVVPETNMMGKINSDVVLDGGKISSEAYVMRRVDNGQIWTGPFHKYQDRFMVGEKHNPDIEQAFLEQTRVKNNKIQDFRALKNIKETKIEFNLLEKQLLEQTLNIEKVDTNIVKSKQSIFSRIYLARDLQKNCRFLFSIDLKKFIRENALLGNILSNDEQTINELLNFVSVKTLKIYRNRLEGSPNIGSSVYEFPTDKSFEPYEQPRKFTGDSVVQTGDIVEDDIITGGTYAKQFKKRYMIDRSRELIIIGTQQGNNIVNLPSTGDGASTLKSINLVYQETDQNLSGIRYITGTDFSVADMTDGYYQYEVEIMLENNIVDYLNQQKDILLSNLEQINKIINIAGARSVNEFDTLDKAVPVVDNKYFANGSKKAYYDPVLNIFTDMFVKDLSSGKILNDVDQNFWQKFPLDYQSALLKLAQVDMSFDQRQEMIDVMRTFLNPVSSNLEGFIEISSMFQSLINIYESATSLYEQSRNHKDEREENQKSKVESTDPKLTNYINMSYTFTDIFDASVPHNFGNFFFNFDRAAINFDQVGLRVISNDDYNTYRNDETSKLYNGPNVDVSISNFPGASGIVDTTSYSFFTPSIFYNGENNPNYVNDPNTDPNKYEPTLVRKLKFDNRQTQKSIPGPDGDREYEDNKIADFFAENFGITAVLNAEPTLPSVLPGKQNPNNLEDRPLDECGTQNTNETFERTMFDNGDQNEQWRKASPIFKSLLTLGITIPQQKPSGQLPSGITRRLSINDLNPGLLKGDQDINDEYIRSLPNQVKALIISQDDQQDERFSPAPPLNFETIKFLNAEPFSDIFNFVKAKYLFEIISTLEVLTGYEDVKFKSGMERSVKAPIWKPLTKEIFEAAQNTGRLLICRLNPYINEKLKIVYNKEENLPILDQFFFLGNITGVDTTSPLGNNIPSDPLSLGLDKPSFQSTNFDMSSGQTGRRSQQRSIRTFGRQARATQSPSGQGGSY